MKEITNLEQSSSIFNSPYFKLIVLAMGVFMMGMDAYIFSPALVTIVKYFHTSYNWVTWTITVYLLFSTSVMPLGGKLADIYGRKKIFMVGVFLFTFGSFLSSLSWDIYSLVCFRAIQAIGGGLILPSALSAMSSYAPKDKQGKTMGVLISASVIATIIGPNIGGYLIENFGWRSIFYINIPIGLLAIFLTMQFPDFYTVKKHKIDLIGAILLGFSLATLLLGLFGLETYPLLSVFVFPFFLSGFILIIVFLLYENQVTEPLLNLQLLSRKDTLSLNVAFLLTFMAISCTVMFVPTFSQLLLQSSVLVSGTILTPYTVTVFIMSIIGGVLIDKIGTKPLILVGLLVASFGFFLLANFATSYISLTIILMIIAIGWGTSSGAFQVTVLVSVPNSDKGSSTAILNTFKGIGGMITPLIGGYFLTNASNNVHSVKTAFTSIFILACILLLLADSLLFIVTFFSKLNTNFCN